MDKVYKKALELLEAGVPFAFAALVQTTGSTPQKAGAKALFQADGPIWGTLGGGCLEAEARQRALRCLDTGAASLFDLRLDEIEGWDDALICGGRAKIFTAAYCAPNRDAYQAALAAAAAGERGLLLTALANVQRQDVMAPPLNGQNGSASTNGVAPGTAVWLREGEIAELAQPDRDVNAFLRSGRPGVVTDAATGLEWFVEPVTPPPRLIVAGGGYIGHAVATMALQCGFQVTMIDDRPAFADPRRIPGAHCICGDIASEVGALDIDPYTYVVIVTRGHRHDGQVLAACVGSPAAYIGMIGSRRKSLLVKRGLVESGLADEDTVARVVSPMGLDIGAELVEEIAVSIVAQLIAVRRGAEAGTTAIPMENT